MNIVLLSGGSGKRLWPLSNDVRSKQFIKIFHRDSAAEGAGDAAGDAGRSAGVDADHLESMVQRVYGQICKVDPDARITIATSKSQVSSIHNQLGNKVNICVEPTRRDTFPAIALAASYLKDELGVSEDEAVIICPVDPYVDDSYFQCFAELEKMVKNGDYSLNLMGVVPTYPSEKYGYIQPVTTDKISAVSAFREKPDVETAQKYIDDGALWNCGVFAFSLKYILTRAHELIDFKDYKDLFDHYEDCNKISFDYAVGEHETSIGVVRYQGDWKDIGSWNTFAEEMHENFIGKGEMDDTCENSNVVNELDIPIIAMGLKNVIVAASNDGILVADKEQSSYIKPYVEKITDGIRFAEKSWGSFTVVDVQPEAMVIRVVLLPGNKLKYHSHNRRDEVWTIMEGEGTVILDEKKIKVAPGDVISMKAGQKHTIIARTKLVINEVQIGKDLSVEDKVKYDFPEGI